MGVVAAIVSVAGSYLSAREQRKAAENMPVPPSAGQQSFESLMAQIDVLPAQLEAEKEFGPQFKELQLEQLREFGPQFAEEFLTQRDILTPEVGAGQEAALSFLGGDPTKQFVASQEAALSEFLNPQSEVLSDVQRSSLEEGIRSAQGQRGLGLISPLGAIEESGALEGLRQQIRGQNFSAKSQTASNILGAQTSFGQTGLTAAGSTTALSSLGQNIGLTAGTAPTLTQRLSPESLTASQTSLYGQNLAREQFLASQPSVLGQVLGSIAGGYSG